MWSLDLIRGPACTPQTDSIGQQHSMGGSTAVRRGHPRASARADGALGRGGHARGGRPAAPDGGGQRGLARVRPRRPALLPPPRARRLVTPGASRGMRGSLCGVWAPAAAPVGIQLLGIRCTVVQLHWARACTPPAARQAGGTAPARGGSPPGPRRRADGRRGVARWSIYALDWQAEGSAELRITPAGVDVMTPAGAPGAKWLAVATRSGNGFRRAAARCGACPRACTPGAH